MTGDGVFSANANADGALRHIAEELFRQVVDICVVGMALRPGSAAVERHVERIGTVRLLLEVLEETADLRFARPGIPYVSNTVHWAADAQRVGLTGGQRDPAPSNVLVTLYTGLMAHARRDYPDARVDRVLDGALRYERDPIDYLCAFVDHGLIPAGSAGVALRRAQPSDGQGMLGRLVELALEQFYVVRAASDFDEWLFGFLTMHNRCTMAIWYADFGLHQADDPAGSNWPLGVRAILSQLEEIRADMGTLQGIFRRLGEHGHLSPRLVLRGFGRFIEMLSTSDDRIREQRLGLPDAIDLAALDRPDLAEPWRELSRRIGAAVAPLYFPLPAWGIDPEADLPRVGRELADAARAAADANGQGRFADALSISDAALHRFPWSTQLALEKAIALDEGGNPAAARDVLVQAVVLEPTNSLLWQSLAVVLRRSGAADEGRTAWALSQFLAERKSADQQDSDSTGERDDTLARMAEASRQAETELMASLASADPPVRAVLARSDTDERVGTMTVGEFLTALAHSDEAGIIERLRMSPLTRLRVLTDDQREALLTELERNTPE